MSQDTLALRGPRLCNITVKLVQGLDQLFCLLQVLILPRLSLYDVLALDGLLQSFEPIFVVANLLEIFGDIRKLTLASLSRTYTRYRHISFANLYRFGDSQYRSYIAT